MTRRARFRRYMTYPSRQLAIKAILAALITRVFRGFLRIRLPASLRDLAALGGGVHADARALLSTATWSRPFSSTGALATWVADSDRLHDELRERSERYTLPFPASWAIEVGTSFLLYSLVRGIKPTTVIEIGVGNGQSSCFILRALRANGHGTLYSLDVEPSAGGLLDENERSLWHFRLIDRDASTESLLKQLASLPEADLCFHDGDHSYLAQYFELGKLWDQLSEQGVMVVDDVDASYALIDFCALIRKRPDVLIDGRKAVAVLPRQAPSLE